MAGRMCGRPGLVVPWEISTYIATYYLNQRSFIVSLVSFQSPCVRPLTLMSDHEKTIVVIGFTAARFIVFDFLVLRYVVFSMMFSFTVWGYVSTYSALKCFERKIRLDLVLNSRPIHKWSKLISAITVDTGSKSFYEELYWLHSKL